LPALKKQDEPDDGLTVGKVSQTGNTPSGVHSYANGHFLAIQEASPAHLLYLGPLSNNAALDLGLLSDWVAQAAP
jgi:hypothetical protein